MSVLSEFGPSIWLCDGPTVEGGMGFRFPTRMAVIRLECGGLAVWSPVRLEPALRQALASLGTVVHVIAPNTLHHVFLAEWQSAYPSARFHAAPGLQKKRPDIRFDTVLGNIEPVDWSGQIKQAVFCNAITTEVVLFHVNSATVIFTDLLQQLPQGYYGGWRALVARLDLMISHRPDVPRKFRLAFRDREAARLATMRVLGWPIDRLLMAHGAPMSSNGREAVAYAFRWLLQETQHR